MERAGEAAAMERGTMAPTERPMMRKRMKHKRMMKHHRRMRHHQM